MTVNEMKKVYWKTPVCLLSTKDFTGYYYRTNKKTSAKNGRGLSFVSLAN